jgi:hypothetical protein
MGMALLFTLLTGVCLGFIKITVLWDVMPCNVVDSYRRSGSRRKQQVFLEQCYISTTLHGVTICCDTRSHLVLLLCGTDFGFCATQTGPGTKNLIQCWTTQSCTCCTVATSLSLRGTVTSVNLVRIDPCSTQIMSVTCDTSAPSASPLMQTVRVVWLSAAISSASVYKSCHLDFRCYFIEQAKIPQQTLRCRQIW